MTFNPIKYRTRCCNDILYSRFPGEFRKCNCGHLAIDQTEFFCRKIGDPGMFVAIEEKDEEDDER